MFTAGRKSIWLDGLLVGSWEWKQPILPAATRHIVTASFSPCLPVQALALPELATTARSESSAARINPGPAPVPHAAGSA